MRLTATSQLGQTSPQRACLSPPALASDGFPCGTRRGHHRENPGRRDAVLWAGGGATAAAIGNPPGKPSPTGLPALSPLVEAKVYTTCSPQQPTEGVGLSLKCSQVYEVVATSLLERNSSQHLGHETALSLCSEWLGSGQCQSRPGQKTRASPEWDAGRWGAWRLRRRGESSPHRGGHSSADPEIQDLDLFSQF